ncbi:MAG TPA: tetratricopeptide repeat protein [Anaerolineaceae bacterium]
MMTSDSIVDVNESDFEYEVIAYSQNTPVVVDFWAPWCIPCKTLGPQLEHLAEEAKGGFRLARVNVDDNPNLAIRFGVRSIPAVKAFQSGQVVSEFTGAQPEARVREFIRSLAPSAADLLLEKAASLALLHQWAQSEQTYRQVLEESAAQPAALLGLAKVTLAQGRADESLKILERFPASKEFGTAQVVLPLAEAFVAMRHSTADDDDETTAAFSNALRLASRGNIPSALDGLLDILRKEKTFRGGQARKVYLGLLELLGENDPQTRQYRADLSMVLF